MFRDFGVPEYLIQETNLTDDKIRAAITVNIAVSWSMALILFSAASLAADFYRSAGVGTVMRIQAVSFLVIPFGAVTMAQFRRDLNFRPVFISNVVSGLVSFSTALGLALLGVGPSSLAWASLAGIVVTVLMSIYLAPKNYPSRPGFKNLGEVIKFGKFVSVVYALGQIGKSAPEIIIGYTQNLANVAMFSRANGLIELFNRAVLSAILPVCLPYFSKGDRGTSAVKSGYLKASAYITAIGWPFFAFMAFETFSVVRALYGPQWLEAIPIARILCLVGAVELIHFLAKEVLIAAGEIERAASLQLWSHGARVVGPLAALPFGLFGVSLGLLAAAVVGVVTAQLYLTRSIGLGIYDVLVAHWHSLALTAWIATPLLVLGLAIPVSEINYGLIGLLSGLLAVMFWLIGLRLFRNALYFEVVNVARRLLKFPAAT